MKRVKKSIVNWMRSNRSLTKKEYNIWMEEYKIKPRFEMINARDTFKDNNKGFIFGINWLDEEGEIMDCEWFKTKDERKNVLTKFIEVEE